MKNRSYNKLMYFTNFIKINIMQNILEM